MGKSRFKGFSVFALTFAFLFKQPRFADATVNVTEQHRQNCNINAGQMALQRPRQIQRGLKSRFLALVVVHQ